MKMWALWNSRELFTINTCTKLCAKRIKPSNCRLIPMVHLAKHIYKRIRILSETEVAMAKKNIKIELQDYLREIGINVPLYEIISFRL